jgi:hypothetical protein
MIEEFEDVIEYIADQAGIYGAHRDGESCPCRVCWTAAIKQRIVAAIKFEDWRQHTT